MPVQVMLEEAAGPGNHSRPLVDIEPISGCRFHRQRSLQCVDYRGGGREGLGAARGPPRSPTNLQAGLAAEGSPDRFDRREAKLAVNGGMQGMPENDKDRSRPGDDLPRTAQLGLVPEDVNQALHTLSLSGWHERHCRRPQRPVAL
ncbi:MAG: hypothetical protein NVSMB17_06020 [Candidatus Dormibacteria bacterium]